MGKAKKQGSILMKSVVLGCLFCVIVICSVMITTGYLLFNESLQSRDGEYIDMAAGEYGEVPGDEFAKKLEESRIPALRRYMIVSITVGFVLMAVFLLGMSIWFSHRIIRPLLLLEQSVVDFARNSREQESPEAMRYERPEITTEDEIEAIADAMESLSDDMNGYMEGLLLSQSEMRIMKRHVNKMDELAYKDALTGVNNKASYDKIKTRLDLDIMNNKAQFAIVMVDLNFLKRINDDFGHDAGDEYIKNVVNLVVHTFEHSPVFRVGGDEFVAVLENTDYAERDALLSTLMTTIEKSHTDSAISPQNRLSAAVGMAVFNAARDEDSDSVFRRADNVMYENKKAMKAVRVD